MITFKKMQNTPIITDLKAEVNFVKFEEQIFLAVKVLFFILSVFYQNRKVKGFKATTARPWSERSINESCRIRSMMK